MFRQTKDEVAWDSPQPRLYLSLTQILYAYGVRLRMRLRRVHIVAPHNNRRGPFLDHPDLFCLAYVLVIQGRQLVWSSILGSAVFAAVCLLSIRAFAS